MFDDKPVAGRDVNLHWAAGLAASATWLWLALAGLAGCPGAPQEESGHTPRTYDTGWALYEAQGGGWSELQPLDWEWEALVLDPDGRPVISACKGTRHCADGGCRESCADTPGWYEPLGPLRMLAVAHSTARSDIDERPQVWLVNDVEGRAWRRSSSEPAATERAPAWDDATSMGGLYVGGDDRENACWCATFADRGEACSCYGGDAPSELAQLVSGATRLWSNSYALASLDGEGRVGIGFWYSYGGWQHAALPNPPYLSLAVSLQDVVALTTAGDVEVYYYAATDDDDVVYDRPVGPPAEGAVIVGASDFAPCWVDASARVHFLWYGWTEASADDASEWRGKPVLGPQLESVPTTIVCGNRRGCAIVDGRLQCWTPTYDGNPSYLYFESLMTTSGARLR